MFLCTLVTLFLCIHSAFPLSWPLLSSRVQSPLTESREVENLAEMELGLLNAKRDQLDAYTRKNDCFKKATNLIKTRCGEDDMGEMERVKAALSMTLCELATAMHHTPPLECKPYTVEVLSSNREGPAAASPGQCVEALSRSAQFWSSYSGYLRDIPQLCFAFRRWNDIDTAKDIYRTTSLEKITLLQALLAHQNQEASMFQNMEANVKDMQDLVEHGNELVKKLGETGGQIEERYRTEFIQVMDSCFNTFKTMAQDLTSLHQGALHQLELSKESQMQKAFSFAEVLALKLQGSLEQQASATSLALHDYAAEVQQILFAVQRESKGLQQEYMALTEQLDRMSTSTSLTLSMMDTASGHAVLLLENQHEAEAVASSLLNTAQEAQGLLHALGNELRDVNGTVMELRNELSDATKWAPGSLSKWTTAYVIALVGGVFGLDLDTLGRLVLHGVPLTRAVFYVVQLVLYIFQTVASSFMSGALVILSLRRTKKSYELISTPVTGDGLIVPPPPYYEHVPQIMRRRPPPLRHVRHACGVNGRFSRIPDRLYHMDNEDLGYALR